MKNIYSTCLVICFAVLLVGLLGFVDNAYALKTDKYIVINYYASWCHACQEEVGELNNFNRDKSDNVKIYGDNVDPDRGDLHITYKQIDYKLKESLNLPRIYFLPTTFILKNGVIIKQITGGTTEQQLLEYVK